jgi:formylmethanofuran dehydrogenase subunit B
VPAIACPFCGLVCDDLLLEAGRVDSRGCAKGAAGFARPSGTREHRIAGRPASLA